MRIASRAPNLFLIALLSLTLAPAAFAQQRGLNHPDREMHPGAEATPRGYEHENEERSKNFEQNRADREGANAPMDLDGAEAVHRMDTVPGRGVPGVGVPGRGVVAPRADGRYRGCAYTGRRGRTANCDYYYSDDGEYYDDEGAPMPGWSPDQPMPSDATGSSQPMSSPNASPGAAKMAPAGGPEDYGQTFSPQGNDELRDKLIAGRKNWMRKKSTLDDANAAMARAEYQQQQTGSAIDPRLVAQQERAQKEAEAAHDALIPLVEQARESGMSPRLLELYNELNTGD